MITKAERVVVVTEDGSRWLLDEEFVQKIWDAYCSDADRHLDEIPFDIDAWAEELDPQHDVMNFERWLFPNARLVDGSTTLLHVINAGDDLPLEGVVLDWAKEIDEGTYSAEYRPVYPGFEIATPSDLNPQW